MDLKAYQQAINMGFSEREAQKIGEDAWEDNQLSGGHQYEPEPLYLCDICGKYEAVTGSIDGRPVCSEHCYNEANNAATRGSAQAREE